MSVLLSAVILPVTLAHFPGTSLAAMSEQLFLGKFRMWHQILYASSSGNLNKWSYPLQSGVR